MCMINLTICYTALHNLNYVFCVIHMHTNSLVQDLEVLGEGSPTGNVSSGDEKDWEGEIEHLLTLEEDSTPNQ